MIGHEKTARDVDQARFREEVSTANREPHS